ncbi:hypothetical protein ACFLV6_03595 [Chloroflexota bacterium]
MAGNNIPGPIIIPCGPPETVETVTAALAGLGTSITKGNAVIDKISTEAIKTVVAL